jgi:hypothetical protein
MRGFWHLLVDPEISRLFPLSTRFSSHRPVHPARKGMMTSRKSEDVSPHDNDGIAQN